MQARPAIASFWGGSQRTLTGVEARSGQEPARSDDHRELQPETGHKVSIGWAVAYERSEDCSGRQHKAEGAEQCCARGRAGTPDCHRRRRKPLLAKAAGPKAGTPCGKTASLTLRPKWRVMWPAKMEEKRPARKSEEVNTCSFLHMATGGQESRVRKKATSAHA